MNLRDNKLQSKFSPQEVSQLAQRAHVDFKKVPRSEFVQGLKVEREHADVLKGNETTLARVAAAHLRELPDYYTRLKKVEKKASLAKGAANKLAQNQGHVSVWDDAFNGGRPPTGGSVSLVSPQGGAAKKKPITNPKFKSALQETLFKKKKFQDQRDLDYMQELQQDMVRKQQDEQANLMAQKAQTTGYAPKPTLPGAS